MQNFLMRSGPGLLVVGAVAALGYAVLSPPEAPGRSPQRVKSRTITPNVRCAGFLFLARETRLQETAPILSATNLPAKRRVRAGRLEQG